MQFRTYGYHSSKHVTKPRNTNFNIKGVELEIDDYDCGHILDELIEDNIITVPSNERESNNGIVIACEDDGSVYKELVFKATSNRRILEGVKLLEPLHDYISNGTGTSCHIHMNRRYIEKRGLSSYDIVKSAEFIAPILYKISGRSYNSYEEWGRSIFEYTLEIQSDDLYRRAQLIENKGGDINSYDARYRIINLNPLNTIELRIFSNYYGFDYEYIKMYLETVDFIIDLAEFMVNKDYVLNYEEAIKFTEEFFSKRKYKYIFEKHDLGIFFISLEEKKLRRLNEQLQYLRDNIEFIKQDIERLNNKDKAIRLLRFLRNYNTRYRLPKFEIDVTKVDYILLESIKQVLENQIEEEIESIEIEE